MNPNPCRGASTVPVTGVVVATCFALMFGSGCIGVAVQRATQTQGKTTIGQHFVISARDTIALDNGALSVTFEEVKADSRCPLDVSCVWEGDATVVLWVKKSGSDGVSLELHTSSRFSAEATYGGYRVRLQELKPQP